MSIHLHCDNISHLYCDAFHSAGACSISFDLKTGQALGIVGESGSGKSTLAKMLMRLIETQSGSISINGQPIATIPVKDYYRQVQMITQEPVDSFNPFQTVNQALHDVLRNFFSLSKHERQQRINTWIAQVSLSQDILNKYPKQLSGGECQRVALVRALLAEPSLLICDEMTSALDVSVQQNLMHLLQELRQKTSLAFLFISHDLALVSQFCEQLLVLKDGHVVEQGNTQDVLTAPSHHYTKHLLEAYSQTV